MVRLIPMTAQESLAFLERNDRWYADERVRVGSWDAAEALALAKAETAQLLPQGLDTPDQFLRAVYDEARRERVGEVWYCIQKAHARPEVFVYWVGINEGHRRRGIATEVLREVETEARKIGAGRILLSTAGDNAPALALYTRLGFHPSSLTMTKSLGPER